MESEKTTGIRVGPDHPFDMFTLSDELVGKIRVHASSPHRHDYEELLIITRGNPVHYIDFIEEKSPAPVVIYVAQGRIHEFIPDRDTRGWCIRYINDFIGESNFHYYSNYLDRIAFAFEEGDCRQKIGILCELLLHEYKQHPDNKEVFRHLLSALLAKLEAEGKHHLPHEQDSKSPKQVAFRTFLNILEGNFRRPLGVGFYADKLNTSERNLNMLCNQVFGKSVSDIIEARKMIEARRELLCSSLTVAEIGFALGYQEKSYFTRVFKKRTGLTPTEFRTVMSGSFS
jgi:AraC-like DNA-binding protein